MRLIDILKKYFGPVFLLVAFWPVWTWFICRTFDRSDEPWGLVALLSAGCFIYAGRRQIVLKFSSASLSLLLVFYIAASISAPHLVLAFIAVGALCTALRFKNIQGGSAGVYGLIFISLPILPSINFFAGYPLRLVTAAGARAVLSLLGFATSQEGTMLTVQNKVVAIDGPCSGISMIWSSIFIAFVLAARQKLSVKNTVLLSLATTFLILFANIMRAATLVIYDALAGHCRTIDMLHWEPTAHIAVGLMVFAISACAIIFTGLYLSSNQEILQIDGGDSSTASADQTANSTTCKRSVFYQKAFIPLCVIAALMPLLPHKTASHINISQFVWPDTMAGHKLHAVTDQAEEEAFAGEFPGAMRRFTDGTSAYFIRVVNKETRQLHPSSDCFRGMGYAINNLPLVVTTDGSCWHAFSASRDGKSYRILERLYDNQGHSWTDVSAWYWDALLGRSSGPWWAVTVATPAGSSM